MLMWSKLIPLYFDISDPSCSLMVHSMHLNSFVPDFTIPLSHYQPETPVEEKMLIFEETREASLTTRLTDFKVCLFSPLYCRYHPEHPEYPVSTITSSAFYFPAGLL